METTKKVCAHCHIEKSINAFAFNKRYKDGRANRCKTCNNAHMKKYLEEHREECGVRVKKWVLKKKEKVAGRLKPRFCEVCGKEGRIVFDHDHITKKFRGWICNECNAALGMVKDNPVVLDRLRQYILTGGGV